MFHYINSEQTQTDKVDRKQVTSPRSKKKKKSGQIKEAIARTHKSLYKRVTNKDKTEARF